MERMLLEANLWENPLTYLVGLGILGAVVKTGMWIGNVNSDQDNFKKFMGDVKEDLHEIRAGVWQLLGKPLPLERGSPLRLTDYGKDIAAKLNATTWASTEANKLRRENVAAMSLP